MKLFFSELLHYARTHKRYWMVPLLVIFTIMGLLVVIAEVAPIVSPLIYTLF